jgi:HAMP domain-containing protein
MKLRREASLGIGAILVLQIMMAMLAIALLSRMGPAIEQILQENVYSGEAVEEMLALLADDPTPGVTPARFEEALRRAQDNVTEDAERPLLVVIDRERRAAFSGDAGARRQLIDALRQLGQVNRDSMERTDVSAKRLGQTGAWAAAMLGALALALGFVVYRRLRLRLELPIEELRRTTHRVRMGNTQARCPTSEGPDEVKQIATDLNWVLDRWLYRGAGRDTRDQDSQREEQVRRALAWVLDQDQAPVVLLDAEGHPVATNQAGMLVELPAEGDAAWSLQDIPGTSLRLARLAPPGAPRGPEIEPSGV